MAVGRTPALLTLLLVIEGLSLTRDFPAMGKPQVLFPNSWNWRNKNCAGESSGLAGNLGRQLPRVKLTEKEFGERKVAPSYHALVYKTRQRGKSASS